MTFDSYWKCMESWIETKKKFPCVAATIRVITKLPNTEQFSKGKGKTHKSTNRQNQSTTGKLGKPQLYINEHIQ